MKRLSKMTGPTGFFGGDPAIAGRFLWPYKRSLLPVLLHMRL